ncbi:hypothetical protein FNT36_25030 [Hymenobacter setariae]|uniref:Uncharacterized protein n=1 Tax=Hymenobacter setariae TaxID=2594794 RepID=A0A558BJT7_9BACT|nr:hypothetical protein [Hymenobacter setariae]TVT36781.1 hypothetical protein FNT36_25030 [Hymenobacter setariae]
MKNEWDFFADVQRRLATGQPLVQGYFANPVSFPFDELRGIVLDEDGTQYELGADYKQALGECIQQGHTPWGLCLRERIICFGQQVVAADFTTDYVVAYEAATKA